MTFYSTDNDCDIDDEIFFGKLTLKEAKKHIYLGKQRQTIAYTTNQHEADNNASIKIIEAHSAPDIGPTIHNDPPPPIEKSVSNPNISPNWPSKWDISVSDESFLKMEKLVMELCMSPRREELESNIDIDLTENETICNDSTSDCISKKQQKLEVETVNIHDKESNKTPAKETNLRPKTPRSAYQTPKTNCNDIFTTPSTGIKTPGNPIQKKNSVTPLKKPFQHVMSPVAFYINSCPKVPLVKKVWPKGTLPGTSCIPKLVKNTSKTNLCNKENVKLPSVAYRSAKETKVVNVDKDKLPKSQWAKQVMSSIPKAVVLKHGHRETSTKKALFHHQEDSFGDLSLHQADVSVCTQKSAFKKPK